MTVSIRSFVLSVAVAAALAGCGGRSGTPSTPVVAPSAAGARTTAVTLSVLVPSSAKATAHVRRPEYISPSTNGMVVTVTSSNAANDVAIGLDLSSSSSACTPVPNGRECVTPLQVTPGSDTFTLTTFDAVPSAAGVVPAGANQLGVAIVTKAIAAGSSNSIGAAIGGTVAKATLASPASLFGGGSGTEPLALTLEDADGNVIVAGTTTVTNDGLSETDTYANPVTVAATDSTPGGPHATLDLNGSAPAASVTVTKSSDVVTLHYDGKAGSPYHATIAATAAGSASALASARFAPLFISATGPNAAAYAVSGSGAPSIALTSAYEPLGLVASEDTASPATFTLTISNAQRANGTIACPTAALFITSSAATGTFALAGGRYSTNGSGCALSISDGTLGVPIPTTVNAVAPDLYATVPAGAGVASDEAEIVGLPTGAAVRRLNAASDGNHRFPSPIEGVAHDPAGNVYLSSGTVAPGSIVTEYPSGSTTSSGTIQSFMLPFGDLAFDDGSAGVLVTQDLGSQGGVGPDFATYVPPLSAGGTSESAYGVSGNAISIAEDQAGEVYLGEVPPGSYKSQMSIRVYQPVTGTGGKTNYVDFTTALPNPALGLACDAAGNLYVADGTTLTEYAPDLAAKTLTQVRVILTAARNLQPRSVAVAGDGTIFAGRTGSGAVDMISPGGLETPIILDGQATQLAI